MTKTSRCIGRRKDTTVRLRTFHTHFMERVLFIVADPTVNVIYRTAIKALFLFLIYVHVQC